MAKNQKRSFLLYESQRGLIALLGEPERAALLTAIYDYAVTGTYSPLPTAAAEVAFTAIRTQLDLDAARYDEVCSVRRTSANARWEKEKEGEKEEKPPKKSPKKKKAEEKIREKPDAEDANACKCTYDEDDDVDEDVDEDEDENEDENDGDPHTVAAKGGNGAREVCDFERFYAAYPRKGKRGEAQRIWRRKIKKTGDAEQVMTALQQALRCDYRFTEAGGAYVPFPSSWLLNDEPWRSDYTPQSRTCTEGAKAKASSSFETDEFFEAALRRSYAPKGGQNAEKTP